MRLSPFFALQTLTNPGQIQDFNFEHIVLACEFTSTTTESCGGGFRPFGEKVDCSHCTEHKSEETHHVEIALDGKAASICADGRARCNSANIDKVLLRKPNIVVVLGDGRLLGDARVFSYYRKDYATDGGPVVETQGKCSVEMGGKYIDRLIGKPQ